MPALAPITINDGKATPVAHTFNPSGPDKNGVNYLYDRSGGIAIGFPTLSLDLREPLPARKGEINPARVFKATVKVTVPTLDPAVTNAKLYDSLVKVEFLLPERSTVAERKDILAYARNILANTNVTALVQDLESIY